MQQTRYMLSLHQWLIASKGFDPVPATGVVSPQLFHGNVYYKIQGNSLVLLKIIQDVPDGLDAFINQEFAALEDFRASKGMQFVTEIALFVLEGTIDTVAAEELRNQKRVSAVNRCYLLPWVLDLSQDGLLTHQGMPYDHFGLLGKDSLLANPLLAEQVTWTLSEQAEDTLTGLGNSTPSDDSEPVTPDTSRPRVTYSLVALCGLVAFLNGFSTDPIRMTNFGAKVNDLIAAGEYWRLITAVFLHFGPIHLGFNMLFLYNIGPALERMYGPLRYLIIYLFAGILGSVASFAFSPSISVGASGALFGLMGALVYFWIKNPKMGKKMGRDIIILLAFNILFGLVNRSVDNWAHFGGLVGGFLASAMVGLPGARSMIGRKTVAAAGLVALGLAGVWLGNYQEATPQRAAFAIQRQLNQALYYLDKGSFTRAEVQAEQVLAKEPNNFVAHFLLGQAKLRQDDYQGAINELELVVQVRPDLAEVHYFLGYSYAVAGKKSEALTQLMEAVKLKPEQVEFKQTLEKVKNNEPLTEHKTLN